MPIKIIYKKGQDVNGLTFLKEMPKRNNRRALFQCHCGKEFIAYIGNIRSGAIMSCGCYRKEQLRIKRTTHGLSSHLLYSLLANMKARCYNKNDIGFKYYGGRGITVCREWKDNFKVFYNWAIINGYKKGLTIERIEVNGNYTPVNCTFIPNAEQAYNRRTTKLTWVGVKEVRKMKQSNPQILLCEIAAIYGVTQGTISRILSNKAWVV